MRRKEMPRCRPVERAEGETGGMGVAETVGAAGAGAGAVNMAAGVETAGLLARLGSGFQVNECLAA